MSSTEVPSSPSASSNRDPDYYFADGDCIIQAENTSFKIHKFLLRRDSPSSRHSFPYLSRRTRLISFPMPQYSLDQAKKDQKRITQWFVKTQPTISAAYVALYARPSDIEAQQDSESADLARLARLAAISHKYEIEPFCDWSWKKIDDISTRVPGKLISRLGGSWKEIERLLNLSVQLQKVPLTARIEEEWLHEVQRTDVIRSRQAFEAALDAAEHSPAHRRFHGRAYHAYIKTVRSYNALSLVKPGDPTTYLSLTSSEISEARTSRLCRGFWSLSQLRLRLSLPPILDDNPSCANHATQCVNPWNTWWGQKLTDLGSLPEDPFDLIQAIQKLVVSDHDIWVNSRQWINGYMRDQRVQAPCSSRIIAQLRSMTQVFEDTLADHFMIPSD